MIKQLSSISAMALLASPSLCAQAAATPPESAANKFMHGSDFHELVARFEDPARAQWQKPGEVIASLGPLDGKTVADIGAGTGYFAFPLAKKAAKVIAIDIDQRFLDYIEQRKQAEKTSGNIETRLTAPNAPGLKPGEADVVLIVDTFHHVENRIQYLKKLKGLLGKGGLLVIVDFRKQKPPPGPPIDLRLAPEQVESELKSAGFAIVSTDRDLLPINTSPRPNDLSSIGISNSAVFESADFLNHSRRRVRPNLCGQRLPENRRIQTNRADG